MNKSSTKLILDAISKLTDWYNKGKDIKDIKIIVNTVDEESSVTTVKGTFEDYYLEEKPDIQYGHILLIFLELFADNSIVMDKKVVDFFKTKFSEIYQKMCNINNHYTYEIYEINNILESRNLTYRILQYKYKDNRYVLVKFIDKYPATDINLINPFKQVALEEYKSDKK